MFATISNQSRGLAGMLSASACAVLCCAVFVSGARAQQKKVSGGGAPENKPSPASITATPNPVPPGEGAGTTVVTWDTGDKSLGQVYLFVAGQPEKLFTQGPKGSAEAKWINRGVTYEFRLYAGRDRKQLLASVKVTRDN